MEIKAVKFRKDGFYTQQWYLTAKKEWTNLIRMSEVSRKSAELSDRYRRRSHSCDTGLPAGNTCGGA